MVVGMKKTLKTYGLHCKQGDWYCNLCHVKIEYEQKIDVMYCPRCGTVYPIYEMRESEE